MPRRKPIDPERSADMPAHRLERILSRMRGSVYENRTPITEWQHRRAHYIDRGHYHDLDDDWQPFRIGESWGGADTTSFLRSSVELPHPFSPDRTALIIDLDGGEALVSLNGRAWQGLDWNRSVVPLNGLDSSVTRLEISIEAYVINFPYDARRGDQREYHSLRTADVAIVDPEREAYVRDFAAILEAYQRFWHDDSEPELEEYLLHALQRSAAELGPPTMVGSADNHRVREAHNTLLALTRDSGFHRIPGKLSIVAHSHLDLLYLWPLKETLRKNCRSVANALSLMREFPDYTFSWSQPWLYEQLQQSDPVLFEELALRVREGRWEPVGAMFVEPDGNLPGGESMIRQIALGQRFFRESFGRETSVCWLPDVFGVMYTLPQILLKSGIRYFSTVKLTIWNDTNDFPYSSFRWCGPDGSEVLAHFPSSHFGQDFSLAGLRRHWRHFGQRLDSGLSMYVYGPADGGGGPTREMAAVSTSAKGFPGLPDTSIDTAEGFFRQLEEQSDTLPIWRDELYLEAHRGTYTTRADLKAMNRRLELRVRSAEILGAIVRSHGGPSTRKELDQCWRHLLLNQFHDTLPGTHVPAARGQIDATYAQAESLIAELIQRSTNWILVHRSPSDVSGRPSDLITGRIVVFNTLSWSRGGLVAIPDGRVPCTADGEVLFQQKVAGHTYTYLADIPSMGWTSIYLRNATENSHRAEPNELTHMWYELDEEGRGVQTPAYEVSWDNDGIITSIIDREHDREILAGGGNRLVLYDDDPGKKFSAWDLADHVSEYPFEVKIEQLWTVRDQGPLVVVFEAIFSVLDSTVRQEMWLHRYQKGIEFRTEVDWRNTEKTLKVEFPLAISNGRATTHLPFGAIERSTHRNTSWDQAKHEVLMHHWADLSESDYGCAVLNDSKYGCSFRDNRIELTLLRSPIHPDPTSDIGTHAFSYAILPHGGDRETSQVHRRAYEFNVDLETAEREAADVEDYGCRDGSFLAVVPPEIVVEMIKQADDEDGVIIRSYEACGTTSDASMSVVPAPSLASAPVTETDLLERPIDEVTESTGSDSIVIRRRHTPYEICTFRISAPRLEAENG